MTTPNDAPAGTETAASTSNAAPPAPVATQATTDAPLISPSAPSGTPPVDGAPLNLVSTDAATLVTPGPHDYLPDKFRVTQADGTVDVEASARKMAESVAALEKKLGSGDVAPKTVDDYKLEPAEGTEAVDFQAFINDPLSKDFLSKAHAKGLSNEQLNFVLNEYLKVEFGVADAGGKVTVADAKKQLGELWGAANVDDRLKTVGSAINAFASANDDAPGSAKRLYDKFGADPDFIAFAAAVAVEVKPDGNTPSGTGVSSDMDVEALMKSEAYWNPDHPQNTAVKARVASHYDRMHNGKKR